MGLEQNLVWQRCGDVIYSHSDALKCMGSCLVGVLKVINKEDAYEKKGQFSFP